MSNHITQNKNPIPNWVTYPNKEWETATPTEAGFDKNQWNTWLAEQNPQGASVAGERHPNNEWGAVLMRGGYIIKTWGDPYYLYHSASVAKCFTRLCLQIAIDQNLITSANDRVQDYWTGEGQLNHPDKYLTNGHNKSVTFKHLLTMTGGFPVSNGFTWRKGDHPTWANPHNNDPDRANYAQQEPDKDAHYSSGGFWRCTQALTHIFNKELKDVLDETLFSKMDIPANRWQWLSGQHVYETKDFYPEWPGYGDFADPPYHINNKCVQGGGGWAILSPYDLARVGLLLATGGVWKGEQLIGCTEFITQGQRGHIRGWGGGNSSTLSAWPDNHMFIITAVTTQGLNWRDIPYLTNQPIKK